jgi:hypothetical protein
MEFLSGRGVSGLAVKSEEYARILADERDRYIAAVSLKR